MLFYRDEILRFTEVLLRVPVILFYLAFIKVYLLLSKLIYFDFNQFFSFSNNISFSLIATKICVLPSNIPKKCRTFPFPTTKSICDEESVKKRGIELDDVLQIPLSICLIFKLLLLPVSLPSNTFSKPKPTIWTFHQLNFFITKPFTKANSFENLWSPILSLPATVILSFSARFISYFYIHQLLLLNLPAYVFLKLVRMTKTGGPPRGVNWISQNCSCLVHLGWANCLLDFLVLPFFGIRRLSRLRKKKQIILQVGTGETILLPSTGICSSYFQSFKWKECPVSQISSICCRLPLALFPALLGQKTSHKRAV